MSATSRFNLDAQAAPLPQDISGTIANDTVNVLVAVEGFEVGDVVNQAVFTAKINKTDSPTAPTSVQVILLNDGSGSIAPLGLDGTKYLFTFPISQSQSVTLETLHGYDIRVWVTRAGVLYDRTVQSGNFLSFAGWTSQVTLVGGGLTTESAAVLTTEG